VAVVASFTSADFAPADNFAANINWGDGTGSEGKIVKSSTSKWDIVGSHQYAKKANFSPLITITDANGATATASSTIKEG
jgi:hypothetical protein